MSGMPDGSPVPTCPTRWRHRGRIPGAVPVTLIALSCPECVPRSPAAELGQLVDALRYTVLGLRSSRAPAGSPLTGDRGALHRAAARDVREAVRRCRDAFGVEPPPALSGVLAEAGVDDGPLDEPSMVAVLDAARAWAATLPAH